MANAGKIKAGEAFVKLFTNKKEFDKGIDAARKKLDKFSNQTGDAGRKMMIAGGALGTPLVAGLKVFGNYEKQLAMVSTMLDDPGKFMPEYSKKLEDMAVKFGESTEVLTKGLYDILSASIEPAKALDVLTVAVKAAKAGMTDTGVATDAITTMLNAYGLSADKAGMISDWFFSVVKRGKTTFPELAANIGN
ncbi:MAG: phage tail tape measure protein, partial [Victivallales bacterium]|nr:phage tail tape measure protein [Victivallales bacterium]